MGKLGALAAELALVTAVVILLGGWAGSSAFASAGGGVALMAALGIPSSLLLLWGRERTNAEFLSSVVGALLGKMAFVAAAMLFVWTRTTLPRLEFVWGLMAGWVLSFLGQAVVLRVVPRRRLAGAGGGSPVPAAPARTAGGRDRKRTTTPRG